MYKSTNTTKTNVESNKETYLALGVEFIVKDDRAEEGQSYVLFDYAEQTIIPEDDWQ